MFTFPGHVVPPTYPSVVYGTQENREALNGYVRPLIYPYHWPRARALTRVVSFSALTSFPRKSSCFHHTALTRQLLIILSPDSPTPTPHHVRVTGLWIVINASNQPRENPTQHIIIYFYFLFNVSHIKKFFK